MEKGRWRGLMKQNREREKNIHLGIQVEVGEGGQCIGCFVIVGLIFNSKYFYGDLVECK